MSVTKPNLGQYLPEVIAESFSTPDIGGGASAVKITGATVGEVLFAMAPNSSGGGARLQYGKLFQANDSGSDDLSEAVMFLANGMDDLDTTGYVLTFQSTSPADGSNITARIIGRDASGPAQDETGLAGLTLASGSIQFKYGFVVEFRDSVSGALTPINGYVTGRQNGVTIFVAAPGTRSVTGEIKFGLEASLDDVNTTPDAGTAPSGISFDKPRTAGSGVSVANSGVLTAGSKQGAWLEWDCAEERNPSADVEVYLLCEGDTE